MAKKPKVKEVKKKIRILESSKPKNEKKHDSESELEKEIYEEDLANAQSSKKTIPTIRPSETPDQDAPAITQLNQQSEAEREVSHTNISYSNPQRENSRKYDPSIRTEVTASDVQQSRIFRDRSLQADSKILKSQNIGEEDLSEEREKYKTEERRKRYAWEA